VARLDHSTDEDLSGCGRERVSRWAPYPRQPSL